MKNNNLKFQILSPDGFTINSKEYTSKDKAWSGFDQWKVRFQTQGYYSSNSGRINLNELKKYCQLVEL